MESDSKKEEESLEFLKLKESIKCFAETYDTIATVNSKLGNLNKEKLEVVMKEISSGSLRDSCEKDFISLSYEEHRNLKLCLENLALMRPKLVKFNSVIDYCASIDAENIFKLLNKKLEENKVEIDYLEKRLQSAFMEIEDLEARILKKEDKCNL